MAGRHGVPDSERRRHASAVREARRRQGELVESQETWLRWLVWRLPVVAVQVLVVALVMRLFGEGRDGWAGIVLVPALGAVVLMALDLWRRVRLRRAYAARLAGAPPEEDEPRLAA